MPADRECVRKMKEQRQKSGQTHTQAKQKPDFDPTKTDKIKREALRKIFHPITARPRAMCNEKMENLTSSHSHHIINHPNS